MAGDKREDIPFGITKEEYESTNNVTATLNRIFDIANIGEKGIYLDNLKAMDVPDSLLDLEIALLDAHAVILDAEKGYPGTNTYETRVEVRVW